jgi:hypothetical protein
MIDPLHLALDDRQFLIQPVKHSPPKSRHWIRQFFSAKTEAEIRAAELKEARLELLKAHSVCEHAVSVISYRKVQIKRLERDLDIT